MGPLLPIMYEDGLLHYDTTFQLLPNDTYNISIAGYIPAMCKIESSLLYSIKLTDYIIDFSFL